MTRGVSMTCPDIPCRGKSSIQNEYGSRYSMYTLRVPSPISLHISVFQKNTGSFRVTSGPWHKLFHTMLVTMVTSKAILPFCSIGPCSQAHLVNEYNCIFTPQVHFPKRNFISIVYFVLTTPENRLI